MNRFLISFAVFAALYCFSPIVESKDLVREFKGSASTTTAEFEVRAPWIVDWRTTGDYPGSMAVEVNLYSSPGGKYQGKVMSTKWVNNGVKMFNKGGRYRFQVTSNILTWTLRVEQLNKLEAEAYKPKER